MISLINFWQSLDVQYTIGVATDVPVYFISVADIDTDFFTSLTDLAEYLITADAPPQVPLFTIFRICNADVFR